MTARNWPRAEHTPHSLDELSPEQQDRMCPSCRIRYTVNVPSPRELYGPLDIDRSAYRWLENAAKVWDAQSAERFPAAEFVAWVRFDLAGQRPFHGDHDGAPARSESGADVDQHKTRHRHRHPDPIQVVTLPRKLRVG